MEERTEQMARDLVSALQRTLSQDEDAESAVEVYKTINWIVNQLDGVKEAALELAQQDLMQRDLDGLRTPAGSAGWTEPRARMLDEEAWLQALASDPRLMRIQREFDTAAAALEQAQEPYFELPPSRFYIR